MRVAVVGAGIAGLAAGCAMALRGFDVTIFEHAPALGEVGAGLQISPNGWRVLEALGVADALLPCAFEPPEIALCLGRSGRQVWRIPMGEAARRRWGAPYQLVHRADLADALAARLQSLAPNALQTGRTVCSYDRNSVVFENGDTEFADMIIGADGLHSVIRQQMHGPAAPQYTGNVAWRALVPVSQLGDHAPPANVTVWAGAGRHAVTTRVRGGDLVNVVCMVETPDPGPEGWRIKGKSDDVLPLFEGWAPPVVNALEAATDLHRWALFQRAPLPAWSDGPVVLIGDAAHPMLPSFAQGAVQALEDAWVLASECARLGDAGKAGRRLFDLRLKRTARIQKMSVENAGMFHRAGLLRSPIYYGGMAVVTRLAPQILTARQNWIYSSDVTADHP